MTLAEFSMWPMDKGESVGPYVARILDIVDRSKLPSKGSGKRSWRSSNGAMKTCLPTATASRAPSKSTIAGITPMRWTRKFNRLKGHLAASCEREYRSLTGGALQPIQVHAQHEYKADQSGR